MNSATSLNPNIQSLENLGYYRSRLLSVNNSINPLIAAATPILLLAEKLTANTFNNTREQLYLNLIHEIRAFENKAQALNYRPSIIAHACYVLCALLDELITQTTWGKDNNWEQESLSNNMQQQPWKEKYFFGILDQALQDASEQLHLLELIYVALSLGYEGYYRHQPDKYNSLSTLADNLYNKIRQRRSATDKQLLVTDQDKLTTTKNTAWKKVIGLTAITIIVFNCIVYFAVNYRLNHVASPLLTMIKQHNEAVRTTGSAI